VKCGAGDCGVTVSSYMVSFYVDHVFHEINSLELARMNTPTTIQLEEVVPMIDLVWFGHWAVNSEKTKRVFFLTCNLEKKEGLENG
jgi:hypothetical protein